MPYLIGDDLIVGILHDKTDFAGLIPLAYFFKRHTVKQDIPAAFAVRSQNGFQMPQECCLAASALAAQDDILTLFDGQVYAVQRMLFRSGIGKGQILDLEMCH